MHIVYILPRGVFRWEGTHDFGSAEESLYANANDDNLNVNGRNLKANDNASGGLLALGRVSIRTRVPRKGLAVSLRQRSQPSTKHSTDALQFCFKDEVLFRVNDFQFAENPDEHFQRFKFHVRGSQSSAFCFSWQMTRFQ